MGSRALHMKIFVGIGSVVFEQLNVQKFDSKKRSKKVRWDFHETSAVHPLVGGDST